MKIAAEAAKKLGRDGHSVVEGEPNANYQVGDLVAYPSGTKQKLVTRRVREVVVVDGMRFLVLGDRTGWRNAVTNWWYMFVIALAIAAIVMLASIDEWRHKHGVPPAFANEEQRWEDLRAVHAKEERLWRVCVYDAAFPHFRRVPGLGNHEKIAERLLLPNLADGATFRSVAMRPGVFTHRINAHSASKAAELLRDLTNTAERCGAQIELVALLDHGNAGIQTFGPKGERVTDPLLDACREAVAWKGAKGLILLGCSVASGGSGREYIRLIARAYGVTVYASDKTVSQSDGVGDGREKGTLIYRTGWIARPDGSEPVVDEGRYAAQLVKSGTD